MYFDGCVNKFIDKYRSTNTTEMEISEIFFFYNGAMTDSGENLVLYFLNKFAYDVSKRKSIEETGVGNGNSIHFLVVGVLFPCKKLSVAALLAYFFSRPTREEEEMFIARAK